MLNTVIEHVNRSYCVKSLINLHGRDLLRLKVYLRPLALLFELDILVPTLKYEFAKEISLNILLFGTEHYW